MSSNAGLDKKFWVKILSYVSHLINWLLSATIGGKTHIEMWSESMHQIMIPFVWLGV